MPQGSLHHLSATRQFSLGITDKEVFVVDNTPRYTTHRKRGILKERYERPRPNSKESLTATDGS